VIIFGQNLEGRNNKSLDMKRTWFLIAISVSLFVDCQTSEASNSGKKGLKDSVKTEHTIPPDTINKPESGKDDCVRSIPEPIIDKSKFLNSDFTLKDRIGYETVRFDNGDLLKIRNEGCETYSISFCFETSESMANSTDVKNTCETFMKLLGRIKDAQNSPIDLNEVISVLKVYKESAGANLHSEIIIDNGDIREFATVVQVKKVSPVKSVFEIEISIGPL